MKAWRQSGTAWWLGLGFESLSAGSSSTRRSFSLPSFNFPLTSRVPSYSYDHALFPKLKMSADAINEDTMRDLPTAPRPSVRFLFPGVENAADAEDAHEARALPDMERMESTMSAIRTSGIKEAIEERVAHIKSASIKKCVMDEVDLLDQDGDGEVVRGELADCVVRMAENSYAMGRQLAFQRLLALVLTLALVAMGLVNFGTTHFAVNEAKDVHVETGSSVLTNEDSEVVATSAAAVRHLSIGTVAFASGISSDMNQVSIRSDDGTLLWEDMDTITFIEADGTSLTKHVTCGECFELKVVMTWTKAKGVHFRHFPLDCCQSSSWLR
ncbi:hypothetical protein ACHAWF_013088 [Thalassiosira exigua]